MTDAAATAATAAVKDVKKSLSSSLFDMAKEKIDAASLIDKAKEKIDAVVHYAGETQGKFGKVKEEIGDLVETVSAKSDEITGEVKGKFATIAGIATAQGDEKATEPIKIKEGTQLHDNDTQETSNDINEDTPTDTVTAPSVYQQAEEEVKALVEKEVSTTDVEGGFRSFIANLLQKICHPWESKKDESKSD